MALGGGVESVLDLLFPRRCFCCGGPVAAPDPLCDSCETDLAGPRGPVSFVRPPERSLSAALTAGVTPSTRAPESCMVSAGFLMRGPGARLIHSLKYEGVISIAPFVAARMARAWPAALRDGIDCLLPVPLHRRRERERGYNQSRLLAEELTKVTGVITAANLLVRSSHTGPQVGLEGRDRWKNVKGAFEAPFPRALEGIDAILIDDVATTGATLRACAEVLLQCGARRVGALVGALA